MIRQRRGLIAIRQPPGSPPVQDVPQPPQPTAAPAAAPTSWPPTPMQAQTPQMMSRGPRRRQSFALGHGSEWDAVREQAQRAELDALPPYDPYVPLIAVIVPVLDRPARVAPLVASFEESTNPDDGRLYFVAQQSDTAEIAAIEKLGYEPILVTDRDRSWAKKINRGYEQTKSPWILLGADDLAFRAHWVDRVRATLATHRGVIGTNDLGNAETIRGTHSTHPLVRRAYADICGTVDERRRVVHEGYDHNYPDTELVATALRRGLYLHRHDCIIEHLHPAWGKGTHDHVYALGQRHAQRDAALFQQRAHRFGLR